MKTIFRACLILCALICLSLSAALGENTPASWEAINQPIPRAEGWQRFAAGNAFCLGDITPYSDTISLQSYGTYPAMDGSTALVPMAMEMARQHLDIAEDDLKGFVSFSTTHYAYEHLIYGMPNPTVTIPSKGITLDPEAPVSFFLGSELSDEELLMAEKAGVELVVTPVCYDAFVFLVNAKNPVNSLTVRQIQDIYGGAVTSWAQVGGEDGRDIYAYQRSKNSGSQTAMENLVMRGRRLAAAEDNYVSDGMSDLVQAIGEYDNAQYSLGYSFLYYVEMLYKAGDIKVLMVDGVAPTPDNLRAGAYPFTSCYYAVYRDGDENAAAFAEWMCGEEGQRAIAQAGYIPLMPL